VGVLVTTKVGVTVEVGVLLAVGIFVDVTVAVDVPVGVMVRVAVGVDVEVTVGVRVSVTVAVNVEVTGNPLWVVMSSCGGVVPSREEKVTPSLLSATNANVYMPFPLTKELTLYSTQEFVAIAPLLSNAPLKRAG
jgi:hypothetical protein